MEVAKKEEISERVVDNEKPGENSFLRLNARRIALLVLNFFLNRKGFIFLVGTVNKRLNFIKAFLSPIVHQRNMLQLILTKGTGIK